MPTNEFLLAPRGNFGRVEQALRDTIRHLDGQGKLKREDHALVAYLVSTAAAVDGPKSGAILRKEYREALQTLIQRCERDSSSGGDVLLGVFSSVGDRPEAGSADLRPADGGDQPVAGHAVDAVATPGRRRRAGAAA